MNIALVYERVGMTKYNDGGGSSMTLAVCMESAGHEDILTKGHIYVILQDGDTFVSVRDLKGNMGRCPKSHLIILGASPKPN